jgi:hypothetical protein
MASSSVNLSKNAHRKRSRNPMALPLTQQNPWSKTRTVPLPFASQPRRSADQAIPAAPFQTRPSVLCDGMIKWQSSWLEALQCLDGKVQYQPVLAREVNTREECH